MYEKFPNTYLGLSASFPGSLVLSSSVPLKTAEVRSTFGPIPQKEPFEAGGIE
jgi:hypothetical protein